MLLIVANFAVLGFSVYKIFQGRVRAEAEAIQRQEHAEMQHAYYGLVSDSLDPEVEFLGNYFWEEGRPVTDDPIDAFGDHGSKKRDELFKVLDERWSMMMGIEEIE